MDIKWEIISADAASGTIHVRYFSEEGGVSTGDETFMTFDVPLKNGAMAPADEVYARVNMNTPRMFFEKNVVIRNGGITTDVMASLVGASAVSTPTPAQTAQYTHPLVVANEPEGFLLRKVTV